MICKNRIPEMIEKKGIKKTEIAKKARMTEPSLSKILAKSDISKINLKTLYAISKALDVKIKDLFIKIEEEDDNAN